MTSKYDYDVYLHPPGYKRRWLGIVEAFTDEEALVEAKIKYKQYSGQTPEIIRVELYPSNFIDYKGHEKDKSYN